MTERVPWEGATRTFVIAVAGDKLEVAAPLEYRLALKTVPGHKWNGDKRVWTFPVTAHHMNLLCNLAVERNCSLMFGQDPETLGLLEAARDIERGKLTPGELEDFPSRTVAWTHQRQAFEFGKHFDGLGLFIEMGGGKTKVIIGLSDHHDDQLVLVVCPKNVVGVWPKQVSLHSLRPWSVWSADIPGTGATKVGKMSAFILRPTRGPKMIIMNYELMANKGMLSTLHQVDWDLIVYDESHKLKAPGGVQSKAAQSMRKCTKRVILSTGTPLPHGKEDAYAQYRACDQNIFGTSFSRFKNRFAIMGGYKVKDRPTQIVGWNPETEKEFDRKFGSISFIVTKAEMTKYMREHGMHIPDAFPPQEVIGQLTGAVDRVYHTLRRELVADLDEIGVDWDTPVVAENALTKLLRLRQITSGFVKDDNEVIRELHNVKGELLEGVLDGIDSAEPVVVFAAFHHDLDVIERAAEASGRVYGELSGRSRSALTADSTLHPEVGVAGVQLQSGGVGIDFTRSAYAVYFSIDFNLGNFTQSMARLDRPGQTRSVSYIHLVVQDARGKDTVDGSTYAALQTREDFIMKALKAAKDA